MKETQHAAELEAFVDLVRAEGCRSYLEIGSKFGTSLAAVAAALLKPAKIVSVDLPKPEGQSDIASLRRLIKRLNNGNEVHLVLGDSAERETVAKIAALAPFDLVFIDANHTAPYVEADWRNYGPMGRVVAFHDIANGATKTIEVFKLWDRIKGDFRHREILLDPRSDRNGIGVLWR